MSLTQVDIKLLRDIFVLDGPLEYNGIILAASFGWTEWFKIRCRRSFDLVLKALKHRGQTVCPLCFFMCDDKELKCLYALPQILQVKRSSQPVEVFNESEVLASKLDRSEK